MPHLNIQPFERNCICPWAGLAPVEGQQHTQTCDDNYRAEFIGRKQEVRDEFYGTDRDRLN